MQVQVPTCALLLDTTLCSLVLDNAISNAFRHGDSPVCLAVTTTPAGDDRLRLCFVLTNQVSPAKAPLTPDIVARAWEGTHRRQAPPRLRYVRRHRAPAGVLGLQSAQHGPRPEAGRD